jgi:hypothetical protein
MKFHYKHAPEFESRYGHTMITSTSTGAEFFDELLACIDGAGWSEEKHQGQYEENFRKLIKLGREQNS